MTPFSIYYHGSLDPDATIEVVNHQHEPLAMECIVRVGDMNLMLTARQTEDLREALNTHKERVVEWETKESERVAAVEYGDNGDTPTTITTQIEESDDFPF